LFSTNAAHCVSVAWHLDDIDPLSLCDLIIPVDSRWTVCETSELRLRLSFPEHWLLDAFYAKCPSLPADIGCQQRDFREWEREQKRLLSEHENWNYNSNDFANRWLKSHEMELDKNNNVN